MHVAHIWEASSLNPGQELITLTKAFSCFPQSLQVNAGIPPGLYRYRKHQMIQVIHQYQNVDTSIY
jgi:hypothetical protein